MKIGDWVDQPVAAIQPKHELGILVKKFSDILEILQNVTLYRKIVPENEKKIVIRSDILQDWNLICEKIMKTLKELFESFPTVCYQIVCK